MIVKGQQFQEKLVTAETSVMNAKNKKKNANVKQPTLRTFIQKNPSRNQGPSDVKIKEITYAIGEMMGLDNQPYSMVENVGFKRLMAKALPQYQVT